MNYFERKFNPPLVPDVVTDVTGEGQTSTFPWPGKGETIPSLADAYLMAVVVGRGNVGWGEGSARVVWDRVEELLKERAVRFK